MKVTLMMIKLKLVKVMAEYTLLLMAKMSLELILGSKERIKTLKEFIVMQNLIIQIRL